MNQIDPTSPTTAFLRAIDIHILLPQQEPFVMVGTLVAYDATNTATETLIQADNIFVENGHFSAEGMVENIAQTCAARIGYVNKYILKRGIQIGFIGSVRHFKLHRLPSVDETVVTSVKIEQEVFGMTLATATVRCGEELLAETEIKIAVKDEAQD